MKSVFYLCRKPDDPELFVFASELPTNYYSPGLFIVEAADRRGLLEQAFKLHARQGLQILNLELRQADKGRAYFVDAGDNGKFYFKAVALNKASRYSGQRQDLFHGMPLYRLEPANMNQLERACIERDFYFIGEGHGDPNNS